MPKITYMKKIPIALALLMLSMFASQSASAFYYYYWWPGMSVPGVLQRYEIGYSYSMMTAKYTSNTQYVDGNGNLFDSSSKGSIVSKGGFGATVGTFIPITRVGDNCMFAISVNYMYNFVLWNDLSSLYTFNTSGTNWDLTGATLQMGFPVGGDFKFGCDAFTTKDKRFCATIGAGAYPALTATTFNGSDGGGFTVSPYLKGEVGVFGGICFKIRAMVTFGNIDLISDRNSFSGGASDITMKGTSSANISLIFMPFAWSWQKLGWWNTPQ